MHGYYAIHLVCTKGGARHHVVYIGHQRGPEGGAPDYTEALENSGKSGPGHRMWNKVPKMLRQKYQEEDFRLSGKPVLTRSVHGMETLITRHLQGRLQSETVQVAESARACAYYSVHRYIDSSFTHLAVPFKLSNLAVEVSVWYFVTSVRKHFQSVFQSLLVTETSSRCFPR